MRECNIIFKKTMTVLSGVRYVFNDRIFEKSLLTGNRLVDLSLNLQSWSWNGSSSIKNTYHFCTSTKCTFSNYLRINDTKVNQNFSKIQNNQVWRADLSLPVADSNYNCSLFCNQANNFSSNTYSGNKNDPEYKFSELVKKENVENLLLNASTMSDTDNREEWSSSVYPANADPRRDQASHSVRPAIDPKETSIILFPGQGSQFVGMGHNLLKFPNVQEMFKLASEILGYDLLKLCLEGPESELDKTRHSQAAVLVTSLAAVEKLKDERPLAVENCVATAGFSVGEFTALTFAGALSFEEAVRLIKIRGEAMQAASELTPSGMMTVFYRADAKINFACHAAVEWCIRKGLQDPVCKVANFLYPHCKVIAGNEEALKFIEMNAEVFGIRRVKHLAVSGAFHTNLMKPAQLVLKEALKQCKINPPLISVHSNVDGKHYQNADIICKNLLKQLCSPVKWEQTMHIIYERPSTTSFPRTFECGPGQSLRTILKMVNAKAWNTSFLVGV